MKVTGFTIARNVVKYDYPIVEAITSILPICDEFVVAVGKSEDATLASIQGIDSSKIRIFETVWDDSLREGGRVLAVETDKALAAVAADTDWAFYIQGDEVLHEKYLPVVREAMEHYLGQPEVEGLLFNYLHFYGSYRYVGDSRAWYRREIRVVRNSGRVRAYRDAQGFRTADNQKLRVKLIDATVYHYGWVRPPAVQRQKIVDSARFWNDETSLEKKRGDLLGFDYSQIDSLALFEGTHPAVMQPRVARLDWAFDFDLGQKRLSLKNRILQWILRRTGWMPFEYRNYRLR